MAINLDFLKETPIWEWLRNKVAKIPTSTYYVIGLFLMLAQLVIQNPADYGIEPVPTWFRIASPIVSLLVLLFTRPKSPVDKALDEAGEAKVQGNEFKAEQIVSKVVELKAKKAAKKAA